MAKTYTAQEADELLPQAPSEKTPDPASLVYLFIGPPKFGKTTWFSSIPDALLLAFERGASFQKVHKISIKGWDGDDTIDTDAEDENVKYMTMMVASRLLKKSTRFPFVIFDTADMAAKMCSDYHCRKNNYQHVSEGGDFGKGYDMLQNTPFRQLVGDILSTGRGIGFITHSATNSVKIKGQEKVKRETSLPGGIFKFIHTQADAILHGEYGIRQKGHKHHDRIIQTAGDEVTLAGNRCEVSIPLKYVMDAKDPWGQWCRFFADPEAAGKATRDYENSFKKDSEKEQEEEQEVEAEVITQEVIARKNLARKKR